MSKQGVHFCLQRAKPDATDCIVYCMRVEADREDWQGEARVALADGQVAFSWQGACDPGDWVVAAIRATLRTQWRRGQHAQQWPRRLNRWRAAPVASIHSAKDER